MLHVHDHAGLQARQDAGPLLAALEKRDRRRLALGPGHHEGRAPAREQRVQHPALRAFRIPDAPPGLVLGHDLDGQSRPLEHPGGAVVLGGALAQVDPIGLQADIARHRQPRAPAAARRLLGLRGGSGQAGDEGGAAHRPHQGSGGAARHTGDGENGLAHGSLASDCLRHGLW